MNCEHLIHKKCSNLKQYEILNFHDKLVDTWECLNCMQDKFPFSSTEDKKANVSLTGKFDILSNNTSHKDTWLPQKPETEKFENEYINLKPNFNCNEIHDFHALISKINTQKTFSTFHTNICSLPANSENLEILLEDLEYKFDVICLSETWKPEEKQQSYAPKNLTGCHAYIGTTGNTAKGGCGFYIIEEIHYSSRTDLNARVINSETEFESCWIEIISKNQPNALIGVFYRHPKKKISNLLNV